MTWRGRCKKLRGRRPDNEKKERCHTEPRRSAGGGKENAVSVALTLMRSRDAGRVRSLAAQSG